MIVYLQVLGCDGSGVPAVLVCADEQKLLFNVPEGTQRFFTETKLKMSRWQATFLTRLHPDTLLGLPGLLLTYHDVERQARRQREGAADMRIHVKDADAREQAPSISVRGPPGIAALMAAQRRFVHCADFFQASDVEAECGRFVVCHQLSRPSTSVLALRWSGGVVYCVELAAARGPFKPDVAIRLGVKKGPKFKLLAQGEAVQSDADPSRTVTPDEVTGPSAPVRRVVIVDAAHAGAAEGSRLLREVAKSLEERGSGSVIAVAHMSCHGDESYVAAAEDAFRGARHLYVGGSDQTTVFRNSARQHDVLSVLAPRFFPPERPLGDGCAGACATTLPAEWVAAKPLLKYVVCSGRVREAGVDASECREVLSLEDARKEWPPLLKEALQGADSELRLSSCAGQGGPIELCFLGTGGMLPSKYRNVSSTLCMLSLGSGGPDAVPILLDAGEGTLGQLMRAANATDVLRRLGLIWISHMHADHHLGLPTLLYTRHQLMSKTAESVPPVDVVGPTGLRTYLEAFEKVCGTSLSYSFRSCQAAAADESGIPLLDGAVALRCVRVDHCPDAWGCVVSGGGGGSDAWKAVFSGDCKPTQRLVDAGMGCDVLVHEATFEDDMEADADAKKHSTVSGALGVARDMQAKCTVLTHFSQRYPKGPPPGAGDEAESGRAVGLAYDLMWLRVGDGPMLAKMAQPLRLLEQYYQQRDDDKRSENQRVAEMQRQTKQAKQAASGVRRREKDERTAEYTARAKRRRCDGGGGSAGGGDGGGQAADASGAGAGGGTSESGAGGT